MKFSKNTFLVSGFLLGIYKNLKFVAGNEITETRNKKRNEKQERIEERETVLETRTVFIK